MISISTIFFGLKGVRIYDAVKKANELGFQGVELRQEHLPEKDVFKTLKKIKADFPGMEFTIHAPLQSEAGINILNPSMGLTKQNMKLLERLFKGAEIVEAKNVVVHTGFREMIFFNRVAWVPRIHWPRLKMSLGKAKKGLTQFMEKATELAENTGTAALVENPPRSKIDDVLIEKKDLEEILSRIPGLGFCLDISHGLTNNNLEQLLELKEKIKEVHVSYTNTQEDLHLPIPMEQLAPLKKISQLKKIPLVLEHGKEINLQDIMQEKSRVEKFLKNF